jgi:hypothetical protein
MTNWSYLRRFSKITFFQVILYEKANLQDQMLRAGEEELRKRQEEIKAVQLDIADIR